MILIFWSILFFLQINYLINDSSFITSYFHNLITIDKPLTLRKYYGMNQSSIDYYPGTMNIILSVPHDGDLKSNLPKRPKSACRKVNSTSKKCYYQDPCLTPKYKLDKKLCEISYGRDINVRLLALALRYELNQLFQLKPFVIINRLERSKIDMNRFIDEGTFGSINTMHAWMRYHFYLKHTREIIINHEYNFHGKGLLIDLHSQEHDEGWVELGYLISSQQLSKKKFNFKSSSFASYLTRLFDPIELITGNKSLGYFISKYNYSATPSPTFPTPPYQSYFEWGYTIEEYGRYENFSAIMIESPSRELGNLTKLYLYARSLALALHDYLTEIEILEALIKPVEIVDKKQCNFSRQLNICQINFFLLLFLNLIKYF